MAKLDFFNQKKNNSIGKLLEELTTLEINTIIKPGMTAAQPPENQEELLQQLVDKYKVRMDLILNANSIQKTFSFQQVKSVKDLSAQLKEFSDYIKAQQIWLVENDYVRVLRMQSFCDFIESKSKAQNEDDRIQVKTYGIPQASVYDLDLSQMGKYRLVMDTRDRVKLQKLFDLGTENIVMQTRFSISGDVVTRIEEGFSLAPRQVILDIHDKHTNLSVNYWKSLVEIVKDIVSGIISK